MESEKTSKIQYIINGKRRTWTRFKNTQREAAEARKSFRAAISANIDWNAVGRSKIRQTSIKTNNVKHPNHQFELDDNLVLDETWGNRSYRWICSSFTSSGHPRRISTKGGEGWNFKNMMLTDLNYWIRFLMTICLQILEITTATLADAIPQPARDVWHAVGFFCLRYFASIIFHRIQPRPSNFATVDWEKKPGLSGSKMNKPFSLTNLKYSCCENSTNSTVVLSSRWMTCLATRFTYQEMHDSSNVRDIDERRAWCRLKLLY